MGSQRFTLYVLVATFLLKLKLIAFGLRPWAILTIIEYEILLSCDSTRKLQMVTPVPIAQLTEPATNLQAIVLDIRDPAIFDLLEPILCQDCFAV